MTDPAITAPVSAQSNDWWRRGLRTLVQFIAGGGLTVLVDQLIIDIPDRYDAYVIIVAGALASVCQNYAEDAGWIPAIGKGTPSAGADPMPEPTPAYDPMNPDTWPSTPQGASEYGKRDGAK